MSIRLKKILLLGTVFLAFGSVNTFMPSNSSHVSARRVYRHRRTRKLRAPKQVTTNAQIRRYEAEMPKLINKKLIQILPGAACNNADDRDLRGVLKPEGIVDIGRAILNPDSLPDVNPISPKAGYHDNVRIGYDNYLTSFRYIWSKPNYKRSKRLIAGHSAVMRMAKNYTPFRVLKRIKHNGYYYDEIKHGHTIGWINNLKNNRKYHRGIYGGFNRKTMLKFYDADQAYNEFLKFKANKSKKLDISIQKIIMGTAYNIHSTHHISNADKKALTRAHQLIKQSRAKQLSDGLSITYGNMEIRKAYKGLVIDLYPYDDNEEYDYGSDYDFNNAAYPATKSTTRSCFKKIVNAYND